MWSSARALGIVESAHNRNPEIGGSSYVINTHMHAKPKPLHSLLDYNLCMKFHNILTTQLIINKVIANAKKKFQRRFNIFLKLQRYPLLCASWCQWRSRYIGQVGTLQFPLWRAFFLFTDKKNVLYFSFVLKSSLSISWITFSNDFHGLLYYDALFFFNWFTTIN